MDTRTFLSRVSAPVDEVVVSLWKPDPTGNNPRGIFWNGGSYADYDSAAAAILNWDKDPELTVYFSVGRMAANKETVQKVNKKGETYDAVVVRRTKAHATFFKAVCFDLDIGDKYETQAEGNSAVNGAVTALGLPKPMVINSGRGIHYYWPLTDHIPTAKWEQISKALRAALAEHQVQIDESKIHDPSMVLRPVGSSHKKQTPWREVKMMRDCPDCDIAELEIPLAKWIGAAPAQRTARTSSVMSAILDNKNLNIPVIGTKCAQVGALLASGGEFDAAGNPTHYALWTASLMLANFATDVDAAILMLAGGHPDFDHDACTTKIATFSGKPPACDKFAQGCASGCNGCPHKGNVHGPGSLNEEQLSLPATPTAVAFAAAAGAITAPVMPNGYYINNGSVFTDVTAESKVKDEVTGAVTTVKTVTKTLVCPYEIHVLGMYHDVWGAKALSSTQSTAVVSVKYPMDGTHEHELPMGLLTGGGKEFATYLGNKQIIIPSEAVRTRTHTYLMSYLASIQSRVSSGVDFTHFGWQKDGSFLCGETLLGSPSDNTMRRLKGSARNYAEQITQKGDREVWAELTRLVDEPGGECLGVSLLTACAGALGNISGAGTSLIAFVTDLSGTGKTQSLSFGNSAFMDPHEKYMFLPKDTANSLYKGLGVLGDLSGAIDELTTLEPAALAEMAYSVSQGREKKSLTIVRDERVPESWRAPVRVTSNRSLIEMYDIAQSKDEPLRMRTLEFTLDTREFVEKYGTHIHMTLSDNFGFALPEIVQSVIDMGGRRVTWDKGNAAYTHRFKSGFLPEERFRRNACAIAYIIGMIGKRCGVFRFDIDRIINYMIDSAMNMRKQSQHVNKDAFDLLGQFLQEHNDQLITTRRVGTGTEQVQFPVPAVACMRMELVMSDKGVVMPGSRLAVNEALLRAWLRRTKDSLPRLTAELHAMQGLITANHRITLYKGCHTSNPGQAHCLMVDMTHPRMATAITGKPVLTTAPSAAILQPTSSQQS